MQHTAGPGHASLSRRERDCLRLLVGGLETAQVAATLGIALSTLHKHLASARRKLGVRRTAQALLCQQNDQDRLDLHGVYAPLIGAFQTCATLGECWAALGDLTRPLGVTNMTFGVVAEPPGQLTNGAVLIGMSYPEPLPQLYREMVSERLDPMVPYVASSTRGILVDNERLSMNLPSHLPKSVREFADALLDNKVKYIVCLPERDKLTIAPLATTFVFEPSSTGALRRHVAHIHDTLRAISRAFWKNAC